MSINPYAMKGYVTMLMATISNMVVPISYSCKLKMAFMNSIWEYALYSKANNWIIYLFTVSILYRLYAISFKQGPKRVDGDTEEQLLINSFTNEMKLLSVSYLLQWMRAGS